MPSSYTTNNGLEKPGSGEQSGTWGDTVNTNSDLMDTSLDGQVEITLPATGSTGTPNDVLPITDGAASDGRNRFARFIDGGDLGGTAYVRLTPNDAEKILMVENALSNSRSIILFQGTYNAANDYVLSAGEKAIVRFDGAGSGAVVSAIMENTLVADFTSGTIDGVAITGGSIASGTTINGSAIGGTTPAAGAFTTLDASGATNLGALTTTGTTILNGFVIGTDLQAYFAGLQSIGNLTTAADKMIYTSGSDTYAVTDLSAFARTILDDANAAAVIATLGLGTAATVDVIDEDDMSTDSATRPPSQQSAKAYTDAQVASVAASWEPWDGGSDPVTWDHSVDGDTLTIPLLGSGNSYTAGYEYEFHLYELKADVINRNMQIQHYRATDADLLTSGTIDVVSTASFQSGIIRVVDPANTATTIKVGDAATSPTEWFCGFFCYKLLNRTVMQCGYSTGCKLLEPHLEFWSV